MKAAAAGYDVVMAPVFPTYLDYAQDDGCDEPLSIGQSVLLEDLYAYDPAARWPDSSTFPRVLGVQCQLWSEVILDSAHLEYMAFPRLRTGRGRLECRSRRFRGLPRPPCIPSAATPGVRGQLPSVGRATALAARWHRPQGISAALRFERSACPSRCLGRIGEPRQSICRPEGLTGESLHPIWALDSKPFILACGCQTAPPSL
jgi:hypothetical protein